MKALILTNEYPPHIYGGAGVHVQHLSRELAKLMPVEVRCFGDQNLVVGDLSVSGFDLVNEAYTCPVPLRPVFDALQRCLDFNTKNIQADIVHCHTWYSHFGGILAKINYNLPLVVTVHSLEPLRPWKREQLGDGYDFTCWLEKTALEMADAVIAVSAKTKKDLECFFNIDSRKIHIIYNGIDPEEYRPVDSDDDTLRRLGVNPREPYILFVGRIARQKGIIHLVNAIKYLDPGFQVVLCAGAPDTPEIAAEMKQAITSAQASRQGLVWIEKTLDTRSKVQLYSRADVFVCPSIYEPFGIINLEAMACGTAVVASAVGGIPEVVRDGETGSLVAVEQMKESPFEPVDPERFARDLAAQINKLMADPAKRIAFGKAGRRRAMEIFSWSSIAHQTKELYKTLLSV